MTLNDIHKWCQANRVDARGIVRGGEFFIRHSDEKLPSALPGMDQIFHWDLRIGGKRHPTSTSDMQRLVSGKMTLQAFTSLRDGG
jgi:hypothetical protein